LFLSWANSIVSLGVGPCKIIDIDVKISENYTGNS